MPINRVETLYYFDELDNRAKDRARDWFRELEAEDFGAHGELFEPAETAANILGIAFATHSVPLHGGAKRTEPLIYWQLDGQGCGASFAGTYNLVPDAHAKITAEFPTDKELQGIAAELTALQVAANLQARGPLSAKIIHTSSNSVHEYSMDAEAYLGDGVPAESEISEAMLQLMRRFAKWIYGCIEADYEYRMSDENVDDAISANEYTFTKEGTRR